jgi:hypothetical protein
MSYEIYHVHMTRSRKPAKLYVSDSEAVRKFQEKYASAPRQEIQIIRTSAQMETPQKLPTPWLADSEWLLAELTKTRETILRIPFRLDNQSDIQAAIDRIGHLERTLRDLLHLHREGQRSFAEKAEAGQKRSQTRVRKHATKIIRIRKRFDQEFRKARAAKALGIQA